MEYDIVGTVHGNSDALMPLGYVHFGSWVIASRP
jgi:hypothetical protein